MINTVSLLLLSIYECCDVCVAMFVFFSKFCCCDEIWQDTKADSGVDLGGDGDKINGKSFSYLTKNVCNMKYRV